MSTLSAAGPVTGLSPEVMAFAAEQGVTAYLPAVIEMTQRIYPGLAIHVLIEEDPEIANDRHLLLDVDTSSYNTEQLIATSRQWVPDLFKVCPSTHVCVFRIATK